ncbi:MAG TPA: hypothetical protein DCG47_13695 [Spirochaetaceae bacterium]|nr:hypothetical protein [Spirochaetaceae bacterium]
MRKRRNLRLRAAFVTILAVAAALFVSLAGCDLPPIYEYWDSVVLNQLEISPSFMALQQGQKATFSILGGKVPYSFEYSGDGFFELLPSHKVEYTAPAGAAEARIGVRDMYGANSLARVMVVSSISQLTIAPGNASLTYGETVDFTFSGGIEPYTFKLEEGSGTVELLPPLPYTKGRYNAPPTGPAVGPPAVVRLEDSSGQFADAMIYVQAGAPPLIIDPVTVELLEGVSITFSAVGGTAPYVFSVLPGGVGSINPGTGAYSSAISGNATVRVTDASPVIADATVTVVPATATPLIIIPRSIDITMGTSFQFSADGGDPPYSYAVEGYGGTISASGVYTAPNTRQGVEKVRVTDAFGRSDTATVKVKKK